MQDNNFIFPFFNNRPQNHSNETYLKAMQTRIVPHFKLASLSTFLLCTNIIIFILIHILFSPESYKSFLGWPAQMNKWLLQIQVVRTNKSYMYQAFTAMFMHDSYLHILGNTLFGLFVMYEMEYSYMLSIPLGILAGFVANCLAVITLQGRLLGFSSVLTSYVGMVVLLLVTHMGYFQRRAPGSLCSLVLLIAMLSLAIIGTGYSLLVHLYGYLIGMILALGFYPKHPQSSITPTCNNIFKGFALIVVGAIIVLAFVR